MLPISLTIEGLYSYQEKQTIDFSRLTQAGIFGIFGAVGSGKSSILEAITFALYGETERLNNRDKRAYNMMNLKSNRSFIEFEFYNFENEKFRVIREFKRSAKNFEDIRTANGRFFQWKNEEWSPLKNPNIESILGISYANFKRTIIIPQGQFREFIELGAKDRTEMMKEIFKLNQYDLSESTKNLSLINQSHLSHINGQLQGFEEVSIAKLTKQKNILKEENHFFSLINEDFSKISEEFQQLKLLKNDWENLKIKKNQYQKLEERKPEILKQQKEVEEFEYLNKIFQPLISEKNRIEKERQQQNEEKNHQEKKYQETTQILENTNHQLSEIQPLFNNLTHSKTEENDIENIIKILYLIEEVRENQLRTEKGTLAVKQVENAIREHQENISSLDKNILQLKAEKIDNKTILDLENWFTTKKNLYQNQENQQQKIKNTQSEISNTQELINHLPLIQNQDTEDYITIFEAENTKLEQEKDHISNQKKNLEIEQKLAEFTDTLHHGEACPLCGSLEHPKIIHFQNHTEEINRLNDQLNEIETQLKEVQNIKNSFFSKVEKIKTLKESLHTENTILKDISQQIFLHQKVFVWENFNPNQEQDFQWKKEKNFEIENQILSLENQRKNIENSLEKERRRREKYQAELDNIKTEEAKKLGEISSLQQQIKILNIQDFAKEKTETLQEKLRNLQLQNLKIEKDYKEFSEKKSELSILFAQQKTTLYFLQNRIKELDIQYIENKNSLQTELDRVSYNSVSEIENIISKSINILEIREVIQNFHIQLETLKNAIQELETNFKDKTFNEEIYQNTENKYLTKEKERNEKQKIITKLETEIERMEHQFKEKEKLMVQQNQLQKREENLKIMSNLFKGAGFVQYVSSIYLRQLCDHANLRFHRMTRNGLSLRINENNDFEIIDYLNNGHSRSVKTLSGGQAFQVSLSLALALAESVQSNAKAEKNFFFIDEGFGTQDTESVNIVFETISNLLKENRIVGIISHIEELKEKIPLSLSITKDTEKGSILSYH